MKKIEVTINGEKYPCRTTMGAMLRFKRETGMEVADVTEWTFSDLCTFLWCCVASASRADGKKFDMSLLDFADNLTPHEMSAWAESVRESQEAGEKEAGDVSDEKKSPG